MIVDIDPRVCVMRIPARMPVCWIVVPWFRQYRTWIIRWRAHECCSRWTCSTSHSPYQGTSTVSTSWWSHLLVPRRCSSICSASCCSSRTAVATWTISSLSTASNDDALSAARPVCSVAIISSWCSMAHIIWILSVVQYTTKYRHIVFLWNCPIWCRWPIVFSTIYGYS